MPTRRVAAFLMFSFIMASQGHAATPRSPRESLDTPAGHQLASWITAFNTGNRETIDQYLRNNATEQFGLNNPAEHQLVDQLYVGRFDLVEVENSTPLQLTGLLEAGDTGDLFEIAFVVGGDDAHLAVSMRMSPRPPAEPGSLRLSEHDLKRALRAKLKGWTKEDRFSGAVLLAQHGRIIFTGAYGYSDRSTNRPNTLDTRFRVGSISKAFTAIAILQQVQVGKIKLADPIGAYLGDFQNRAIADSVTVRQLLTHTGGTGDFFGPEFDARHAQLRNLDDYVAIDPMRALEFEPGEHTNYSNYGYILLGSVIEHVAGENYYDYIREHVYAPAGMSSSDTFSEDQKVPNRAVGYMRPLVTTTWIPSTNTLPNKGSSAGGSLSNVNDLLRFSQALLKNKLLAT